MDHALARATAALRQYVIVEDCLTKHSKLTSCAIQAGRHSFAILHWVSLPARY